MKFSQTPDLTITLVSIVELFRLLVIFGGLLDMCLPRIVIYVLPNRCKVLYMIKMIRDLPLIKYMKTHLPWVRTAWQICSNVKGTSIALMTRGWRQLNFRYILARNQPYFGHVLSSSLMNPNQENCMKQLIQKVIRDSTEPYFYMLEVGAWAGRSAIVWADAIKTNCDGIGLLICLDVWEPFESKNQDGPYLPWMQEALKNGKVYELFLHNILAVGLDDVVKVYKGSSEKILPTLRDNFFNMVYIDGNHQYSHVISDIEHGARLTSEGGVLCGDDLEFQMLNIDELQCREHKEEDYFEDPKGRGYHPGVTLAIYEFFNSEVSSYNGFWAMRKTKQGWLPVQLVSG